MFCYDFPRVQSVGKLSAGTLSGTDEAVDGSGHWSTGGFWGVWREVFWGGGCLALAFAAMLDSLPIFARRISFRHGLGGAILGMAAGKICGSLFYFATELHRTVQ